MAVGQNLLHTLISCVSRSVSFFLWGNYCKHIVFDISFSSVLGKATARSVELFLELSRHQGSPASVTGLAGQVRGSSHEALGEVEDHPIYQFWLVVWLPFSIFPLILGC